MEDITREARFELNEAAINGLPRKEGEPLITYEEWREKNSDPYGRRCFTFAEDWGILMDKDIADNPDMPVEEVIAKFAKERCREADTDGITGFMYGAAVSTLAACWVHGEELRKWHNLDTQIGEEGERANKEGGTLNPALLNICT